jgi:hypothetical protein
MRMVCLNSLKLSFPSLSTSVARMNLVHKFTWDTTISSVCLALYQATDRTRPKPVLERVNEKSVEANLSSGMGVSINKKKDFFCCQDVEKDTYVVLVTISRIF